MERPVRIRVDNRLLHGQVVQFWIPFLGVQRLLVADDEVAANPAMLAVYRLAAPKNVEVTVTRVASLCAQLDGSPAASTLVLVSDVSDAARAQEHGYRFDELMIGNVHATPERRRITDAVYLSADEERTLLEMTRRGVTVGIQTFPSDALRLGEDVAGGPRWSKH
ncbi:MAG: PTS sugar transporter subunit IIB [Deltaproteobacteria bacterium]|nr:PTS sugar transporter subunit IIB [Deltaproteobacteria bacterium]